MDSTLEDNEPANKKIKSDDVPDKALENDVDHPDLFPFPEDQNPSDILHEVEFNGTLPSVTERYFTPYYRIDIPKPGDDICIRVHSNRICMLSLAPSHSIFQDGRTIEKVNYKISDKLDRSRNTVSGKSKHGAQPLQANSNLCFISCTDGSTYSVKCCMIGKLVEVNESLMENPDLLREVPHKGGYIAIFLPNLKFLEDAKKSMLTEELYQAALLERQTKNAEVTESSTMENQSCTVEP